jgi:predicted Zn-dependent protease
MNQAKILKVLRSLNLDAWSVLFQVQEKSTLHLTKGEAIETGIDAVRKQAEVVVYKRSGLYMGDAKFTLYNDDEAVIKEKVADALVIAQESLKPGWPLPKKQTYGKVSTADVKIVTAFKEGKAEQINLRLWRSMKTAAKKERACWLCHAELHLVRTRNTIVNSEGVNGKSEATTLFAEAIMTAKSKGKEQEFHNAVTVGCLKDFSPARFVKETAKCARDVLAAKKWKRVHQEGIVLSGVALRDFWAPDLTMSPVVAHANAQAKHRHLSVFEQGKRITNNEAFTLCSDPFIPHNPASGAFDNEGTASKLLVLVEKGVCKGMVAQQRFAHYLGIKPTGALGVVSLKYW